MTLIPYERATETTDEPARTPWSTSEQLLAKIAQAASAERLLQKLPTSGRYAVVVLPYSAIAPCGCVQNINVSTGSTHALGEKAVIVTEGPYKFTWRGYGHDERCKRQGIDATGEVAGTAGETLRMHPARLLKRELAKIIEEGNAAKWTLVSDLLEPEVEKVLKRTVNKRAANLDTSAASIWDKIKKEQAVTDLVYGEDSEEPGAVFPLIARWTSPDFIRPRRDIVSAISPAITWMIVGDLRKGDGEGERAEEFRNYVAGRLADAGFKQTPRYSLSGTGFDAETLRDEFNAERRARLAPAVAIAALLPRRSAPLSIDMAVDSDSGFSWGIAG